jgi:hypothetical protein
MRKLKILVPVLPVAAIMYAAPAHADWPDCSWNSDGTHAYCHDSGGRMYEVYCNPHPYSGPSCETEP